MSGERIHVAVPFRQFLSRPQEGLLIEQRICFLVHDTSWLHTGRLHRLLPGCFLAFPGVLRVCVRQSVVEFLKRVS